MSMAYRYGDYCQFFGTPSSPPACSPLTGIPPPPAPGPMPASRADTRCRGDYPCGLADCRDVARVSVGVAPRWSRRRRPRRRLGDKQGLARRLTSMMSINVTCSAVLSSRVARPTSRNVTRRRRCRRTPPLEHQRPDRTPRLRHSPWPPRPVSSAPLVRTFLHTASDLCPTGA